MKIVLSFEVICMSFQIIKVVLEKQNKNTAGILLIMMIHKLIFQIIVAGFNDWCFFCSVCNLNGFPMIPSFLPQWMRSDRIWLNYSTYSISDVFIDFEGDWLEICQGMTLPPNTFDDQRTLLTPSLPISNTAEVSVSREN